MRFAHARHYNSPFSAHDFFMDQLKEQLTQKVGIRNDYY